MKKAILAVSFGTSYPDTLLKTIAARGSFGFFACYCWLVGTITLGLTILQK